MATLILEHGEELRIGDYMGITVRRDGVDHRCLTPLEVKPGDVLVIRVVLSSKALPDPMDRALCQR